MSSKNRVPPSASSSFPAFSGVPKSRDPALSRVKPPQFMGMKGPLNRGAGVVYSLGEKLLARAALPGYEHVCRAARGGARGGLHPAHDGALCDYVLEVVHRVVPLRRGAVAPYLLRRLYHDLEAYYVLLLTYGQALDIVEPAVLLSEGELHVSGGYLLSRGERLEHEGESGQLAAEGLADYRGDGYTELVFKAAVHEGHVPGVVHQEDDVRSILHRLLQQAEPPLHVRIEDAVFVREIPGFQDEIGRIEGVPVALFQGYENEVHGVEAVGGGGLAVAGDADEVGEQAGVIRLTRAVAGHEWPGNGRVPGENAHVLHGEFCAYAYAPALERAEQLLVAALVKCHELRVKVEDGPAELVQRGIAALVVILEICQVAFGNVVYPVKDAQVPLLVRELHAVGIHPGAAGPLPALHDLSELRLADAESTLQEFLFQLPELFVLSLVFHSATAFNVIEHIFPRNALFAAVREHI